MGRAKFFLPFILLAGAAIWASCDSSTSFQPTGGEEAFFTVGETDDGGVTVTDNGTSVNPESSSSSGSGGTSSSSSSSSGGSSSGSSSSGSSSSGGSSSGSSSSSSGGSSGICAEMEVTTPSPDLESSCSGNQTCSVDAARIDLNDDEIFPPDDFNNHPFTKSEQVDLKLGLNVLRVWISGNKGDSLLVKIFDCTKEPRELLYRRTFAGHSDTTDTFARP